MCKMFVDLLIGLLIVTNSGNGAFLNISDQEVLLMAGGGARAEYPESLHTVEVFVPSTGESHLLDTRLAHDRISHTMDNGYLCGGEWTDVQEVMTTCIQYSPTEDQWTTSHNLEERRTSHSSWMTDRGLVLMGGWYSDSTSEIVPVNGGKGGPAFDMKYRTKYACSIPDLATESVIITGGGFENTDKLVSRYDMHGHVEDLPQLAEGRFDHGCGAYLRGDGTQVLLVAGGLDLGGIHISSTEILVGDSRAWTTVTPLPKPSSGTGREGLGGIKGAKLGNTLYMTGGYDGFYNQDEILEWRDEDEEWVEIGRMIMRRSFHSMSTIKIEGGMIKY